MLDIAHRVDEDAVVILDGFAVWVARMVDPARIIAADLCIDYFAVFQAKIECVRVVVVVGSSFPGNTLAGIFDNARAFGNELRGVNTATVHTGFANLDPSGSLSNLALLRHAQWGIKPEEENQEGRIRSQGRISERRMRLRISDCGNKLARMTPDERSRLESLDEVLRSTNVREQIRPIVNRVRTELTRKKGALMAWEPIPLPFFGRALPPEIRSAWVFVLRAGADT